MTCGPGPGRSGPPWADGLTSGPKIYYHGRVPTLTLPQTAERLGLAAATIRRHVYQTKLLEPLLEHVGRTPVFDESQLPEIRRILDEAPARGGKGVSQADVTARQDRALAMHRQGDDWNTIAARLQYANMTGAKKAVAAAEKRERAQAPQPARRRRR